MRFQWGPWIGINGKLAVFFFHAIQYFSLMWTVQWIRLLESLRKGYWDQFQLALVQNGFLYLTSIRRIRLGDYSTILTSPEVNNCFSIFTRSDLNRIRKETIKKRLVWLTGEFMCEHEAVNSGCAKIFTVSSNMANDSFNLLYRVL